MTLPREDCDPRRLDLMLHSELSPDSHKELEAHLDCCPACRDHLDQLAGGAPWWSQVRHYLGGDGASALPIRSEPTARRAASVDLSFLAPSANASSLGRLGLYEILEVVGRGGMGVVLKAFDPALHRTVAIKVLAAEFAANPAARMRFDREAKAVAAVIHDHVVPVHAVDADATPPYLVMSYIAGQSLQQRLDRSGPLAMQEILRIGMQTASGLAAAHAQGIVHRDIKPANIMLENGVERVRITDFGLARLVHDVSITQTGAVTGTPQYMAPEQAEGDFVDQRNDLFALGSVLYAMATGQPPFRGESTLAVVRQVCDTEPIPVRQLRPDLPAWLAGIIQKLHRKDPAERIQSASELAELLEGCLAHVQQPDRHTLPPLAARLGSQVPQPSRHHWRQSLAAAVVLGVCCSAVVYITLHPDIEPSAADSAPVAHAPTAPTPEAVDSLARSDAEFPANRSRLQEKIDSMRQEIAIPSPAAPSDFDAEVRQLSKRTDKLQKALHTLPVQDPDDVNIQLDAIRHRLGILKKNIGGDGDK